MFEEMKIEACPYCSDDVRVRFKISRENMEKLRALIKVDPYSEPDLLFGTMKGDERVLITYGAEDDGPCDSDTLTLSLAYDRGEDELDGTQMEIDYDRAWAQFIGPLCEIKRTLGA